MKIIVTRRTDDYHACLEGHPEIWGCGKTPRAAVGDLIWSHPDIFGVKVELKE